MEQREPFTVAGILVHIKELTVDEITAYLKTINARTEARMKAVLNGAEMTAEEMVDRYLIGLDGITMKEVIAMTDLKPGMVKKFTPREIKDLVAECKRVNEDFFALPVRRLEEAALYAGVLKAFFDNLKQTPPSSSATGTPTSTLTPGAATSSPLMN